MNDKAAIVRINGDMRERFEMKDLREKKCVLDSKSLAIDPIAFYF